MPLAPLDHHATGYQLSHAYWLAKASELAYRDQDIARAALAEWGFDRFRHFESRHQMPFPLEDTQAYTRPVTA